MAVILKREIGDTKCWACGFMIEYEKPIVTLTVREGVVPLHPRCAQSMSRQLLQDITQVVDLGFEVEEESWETD